MTLRLFLANYSPLEGESQKPSRQATADAVGGAPSPTDPPLSPLPQGEVISPHRLACGLMPLFRRLPLKGGVMRRVQLDLRRGNRG